MALALKGSEARAGNEEEPGKEPETLREEESIGALEAKWESVAGGQR